MTPAEIEARMPEVAKALSSLATSRDGASPTKVVQAMMIASLLNMIASGYCAMHAAIRSADNPGKPEAWIGDPETIFVWGTHDPEVALSLASPLWPDDGRPPEADIAHAIRRSVDHGNCVWLHPSLDRHGTWHPALISEEMIFGWAPLTVIDL